MEMTACRSALACHDILAAIFDQLAPGSISQDNSQEGDLQRKICRKALASSAVVCTSISHHGLSVLWRELDDIHPLLRVLPNYKWVGSRYVLSGAILPKDWTRFRIYAERVRVIHGLEGELGFTILPSVWMFLAARCKGSPLMPRLRRLFAHNIPIPDISALTLLISPTLRIVELSFVLEDEGDTDIVSHAVSSLLDIFPLLAPDLEHFTYNIDLTLARQPVNLGNGQLESFKRHFTRLRTLAISCEVVLDSDHVLQSLSAIPTLQNLKMTSIVFPTGAPLAMSETRFEQLATIFLGGHFDHLVAIFQACELPRLTSITLIITHPPSGQDTRASIAAICRRCDPALLTSFTLKIIHIFEGAPHPPTSLMQYLEPLLAFPNITLFHIYFFYIVPPVSDDDLARFGAAWPRLAAFRISHFTGEYSQASVARPTLLGLVELARRCPSLGVLCVPELDVTAAALPPMGAVPLLRHRLRHLGVRYIVATLLSKSYMDIAAVLDRVFPAVDLESAHSEIRAQEVGRGWMDVLQYMEAIRMGRETAQLYASLPEVGER